MASKHPLSATPFRSRTFRSGKQASPCHRHPFAVPLLITLTGSGDETERKGWMTGGIEWLHDAEQAKEQALTERKTMLIDVMKDNCRGCDKLDAVTYPDPSVVIAVMSRFVPLKLNLFQSPRQIIRPLDVIWTPTILFADRRGTAHHRSVNFLPPGLFLTLLDIGEANVDLRWSRTDHAIDLLRGAYQRDSEGALAPEVLYHLGIAAYLKTHSNDDLYGVWDLLRQRFPDSIWTSRIP